MPFHEGLVERQCVDRRFAYDKHEVTQDIDFDGFHILKAATADGILRALAVLNDVS